MKDACEDWTRPGDTLIKVKWNERQQVLQLLGKDAALRTNLSNPVVVGTSPSRYFNLVVDGSRNMGPRAHVWKPDAQVPIGANENILRALCEKILPLVTRVSLDPVQEWILEWPLDSSEVEFSKRLSFSLSP